MKEINSLYAFIVENKHVPMAAEAIIKEGIMGEMIADTWMPFVFSEKERIESLLPFAEKVAKEKNVKIKVVEFVKKEVLKKIGE